MATATLSLQSVSQPIDINETETASIRFRLDSGGETVSFTVFATPSGGGDAIAVGSTGGNSGAGTTTQSVNLTNIGALDPTKDYVFTVVSSDGVTGDGAIGPLDVTCFAEGTLIATARGEVAVQDLRIGDLVVNMHGGAALQPIRWMGHTRVNIARQPDRSKAAPVLIMAGALGEGVPHRDLRVSPEHAMFLDGHLVPAHLLVNGSTIVQEVWCAEVTYWHVELDAHGLLLSEGAVSESYFDDGNRQFFDNSAVTALVKDYAAARQNGRYREAACSPVLEQGPALERIRLRLAARAALRAQVLARSA